MICQYLILFYLASVCGWIWEVFFFWITNEGGYSLWYLIISYRGVLHGPWAPIYGLGFIALVFLWEKAGRKKYTFFLSSMASCAVVEYGTAVILEKIFQAKWWDYSEAFLNLHGRICFVSVVGFGVIGAAIVLIIMPLYKKWIISRLSKNFQKFICLLLSFLFITDMLYSVIVPNMGLGVSICP